MPTARTVRRGWDVAKLGRSELRPYTISHLLELRLLLGHAVQGAESEDQVAARDSDDFAAGEEFGEFVERNAIVRVVERGHDNEIVCNIEIRVARGETEVV